MRRAGLVLIAVAGALLVPSPLAARAAPPAAGPAGEARALALLTTAARAGRTSAWSGTQYVASWRGGTTESAVLEVSHAPARGTVVVADAGERWSVPTFAVDEELLEVLAAEHELVVTERGACSGRSAQVVEARQDGRVAGRFWVDDASGLLLRREVFDEAGHRLRSTAFVELQVLGTGLAAAPALADDGAGRRVGLDDVLAAGLAAPERLPGGHVLHDVRAQDHDGASVLHLSYSDGLTSVSLFAQSGALQDSPGPGYAAESVGDATVWTLPGTPERVVWSGGGQVFTVVSDASPADVRSAVLALPHDAEGGGSLLDRLGRGLARIGSWFDPTS